MGGGRTSSTNQTFNKNASTSTAIGGDNLGVVLSGVSDSYITMTDYGAIDAATGIASKAIDSNSAAIKEASGLGREALKENSSVSKSAMDNMLQNSESSMFAIKSMAVQSGENARVALAMADNVASRSQVGAAGEMSKVAIAVAVVLGVGFTVLAVKVAK